ncbi:hypothetical protein BVC80_7591g4 [Macleaya cordata]|uniref:Uncharacterized protein n=1 Tax=Macleaya cordata TaxID=56857 RepID=A0A200PYA2_MACCD|nr:hypothetical protein BVC80_7591g4 [Macleaya cordata]
MDLYGMEVPGSGGKTCWQIFEDAVCDTPAGPSYGACLGNPRDTSAHMYKPKDFVNDKQELPWPNRPQEGQIFLAFIQQQHLLLFFFF